MPYEVYIRNETAHRIEVLKQKIINNLWMLAHKRNGTGEVTFEIWSKTAHLGCVSFSSYMQKLKSSLRVQDRAASSI